MILIGYTPLRKLTERVDVIFTENEVAPLPTGSAAMRPKRSARDYIFCADILSRDIMNLCYRVVIFPVSDEEHRPRFRFR